MFNCVFCFLKQKKPQRERRQRSPLLLKILGSLRGEAPHKTQDGWSEGEGRSPSPKKFRMGGLGGWAKPFPPESQGGGLPSPQIAGEVWEWRSPPQLRGDATFLISLVENSLKYTKINAFTLKYIKIIHSFGYESGRELRF